MLSYEEFFKKYPQYYRRFNEIVAHWNNFGNELRNRKMLHPKMRVLSIGSGTGRLELQIASDFGAKITIVEPSQDYVREFRDSAKGQGLEGFCEGVFETGFESASIDGVFDLVLSVHSWYAFGFNQEILERALRAVAPGGKLFITVVSESSITWKLSDAFSQVPGSQLSAEAISNWASKLGFEHDFWLNHWPVPEKRFWPEGNFSADGLSEDAKAFASFLTFTPWEDMPAGVRDRVVKLLLNERDQELIDLKCGVLVFKR